MRRFGLLAAIATLASGCGEIIGAEFDEAAPRETVRCDPLLPPEPPSVTGAGDAADFTVVVRAVDYGDSLDSQGRPRYLDIGYDLDGACSTDDVSTSPCKSADWLTTTLPDGPRGQDATIGRILRAQELILSNALITSQVVNDGVAAGVDAPLGLIRVKGYGGFSNDDRVEVEWFTTVPPAVYSGGSFVPRFDGTDEFPVRAENVDGTSGEPRAIARDPAAYVSDGTVVARFATVDVPMANVYFDTTDVVLTGKVARDSVSDRWQIANGVFSGTATELTVLRVIPEIAYSLTMIPLCPDDPNFPSTKELVCVGADLRVGEASGTTCNAMSVGIRLTTAPAKLGEVVSVPPPPDRCSGKVTDADRTCAADPN